MTLVVLQLTPYW